MSKKLSYDEFLALLKRTGRTGYGYETHPAVLQAWLDKNQWASDKTQSCLYCIRNADVMQGFCDRRFSEEVCRENVSKGGTCYREMLKTVFIPMVQDMLREVYPSQEELETEAYADHRAMGLQYSGTPSIDLWDAMNHELGGMVETMMANRTLPDF